MAGPSSTSRGVSVVLLLIVATGAVVGVRLWMSYNNDRQAPARLPLSAAAAASAPLASTAPPTNKVGLLRQDDKKENPARAALFKSVLEGNGQRCDGVTAQLMRSPGKWVVTCRPGQVFRLEFDERGSLAAADKLQSAAP
jgi:hypothetical protein